MRRIISSLVLILLLFNYVFCNKSYAADPVGTEPPSWYKDEAKYSKDIDTTILDGDEIAVKDGSSNKSQMSYYAGGNSAIGMVAGILARLVNIIIALQVDLVMGILSKSTINSGTGDQMDFWFTMDRCVFNKISLFNINYFSTDSYKVGEEIIEANDGNKTIKLSVTKVYYICRIIALSLSLLVLIYIGIRMAMSTVASDKARYKKMLYSWIESIIVLFVMLYIISFIVMLGESLTSMFYSLRNSILSNGEQLFEDKIREEVWTGIFTKSGFDVAIWSIIYWALLLMEVKFFTMYLRRFLMVGLLIVVSPLIIITYSLDKAGDGKAQVFNNWMKEFIISVLIQPLHALIYLVFIFSANSIASRSPLVALALMFCMTTVEKMVKLIFNVKNSDIVRDISLFKKGGK